MAPPKPKRARTSKSVAGVPKYAGQLRYPQPATKNENISLKLVRTEGGVNLNSAGIVRFKFRSGMEEMTRFPQNGFYMKRNDSIDNPGYLATGTTPEITAKRHLLRASAINPGVYLDPYLDASAFFSKVSVRMDNEPVDMHELGDHLYVYQGINRRYTTDEFCALKYGKKFPRVSTTKDRFATAATVKDLSPAGKLALESMNWSNFHEASSTKPLVSCFSFDVFPFNFQSNILAAITKETHENAWFRPDTEFTIDLFKRYPAFSCVESTTITDDQYETDAAVPDAGKPPEMKGNWVDLVLVYESWIPDRSHLSIRGPFVYYVDVPQLTYVQLQPQAKSTQNTLSVPEGTLAGAVFWTHQNQVWYDETTKKNLHTRLRFLPNNNWLGLELTGHDQLFYREGFTNLGISEASVDPSCIEYHKTIVKKGLFDLPLSKLFPDQFTTEKSYAQALLLDLTDFKVRSDSHLTCKALFDTNMSPKNHYMWLLTIRQFRATQDSNRKWKLEPLAG